ncbi:zinc finger protein 300-like isoform X2 [Cydia pomonella]|uniref:zinc finger protein 300-like isoform X2 n=1 Tax=Cydia pomonella TaxID=82600 RepID=UPI002ADE1916|nr:zinc finger protein 300-like isoform X2 [Cydia pomonella]
MKTKNQAALLSHVELNDCLPQEVCHTCISFINETMKFRKKCELTQITLRNKLNNDTYEIKQEFIKPDTISIDISEYVDDDFKDYDDNITLNTLQYTEEKTLDNKCTEKFEDIKNIENENKVQETTDNKVILEEVKKEVKKRRVKKTEMNGQKVKEEIECEYCHKILTSKLSIRNHYKIHTGFDVICEHCGKKFITRRLLLMHCRAKHGYEKTDKCSYCDYRASNAEQVKIHERLHTGEKPYVCEQCGAGFHRKSSYLQHIAIHLPEKTVQCTVCPARFKSVTLMRIHAARHRAPRYTFQCTLCENSFARRRCPWEAVIAYHQVIRLLVCLLYHKKKKVSMFIWPVLPCSHHGQKLTEALVSMDLYLVYSYTCILSHIIWYN